MKKKIYNFFKGLFEFTKVLTIVFTVFYLYAMHYILDLARISVEQNYMGSLPYLTAVATALSGTAAAFYASVIKKSEKENLNKHSSEGSKEDGGRG